MASSFLLRLKDLAVIQRLMPAPRQRVRFPALLLSLLLAAAGGYADTAVFLYAGTFTGHITGNTVLSVVHFGGHETTQGVLNAAAVLVFLAGSFVAMLGHDRLRQRLPLPVLSVALFLEALLLLPPALTLQVHHYLSRPLLVILACSALGIQNGTLTKVGQVSVHTTFLTGMATNLMQNEAADVQKRGGLSFLRDEHARTVFLVWIFFLLGAGAAAGVHAFLGASTLLVLAGGLILLSTMECFLRITI